ncbi:Hsp70 family protein [Sulfitobacter sp. S190]|uniref:Hsp70 family protein n=1 Tax=Sulfitobacter sp. S190 TaxID=2867022 RepID=UPI0021A756D1|nr:Hsp70 family protein [Sulfitobacter sp. S190]UWR22689.1 Hsp70 family protein [Sulfitobacter sp. S190]
MAVLGVDFGTSNSAAAVMRDGIPFIIPLEPAAQTLPTAVFFDFDARRMSVGSPAGAALLAGDEGRYMRALKSLLGTALMRETRNLLGERIDFIEITARFLREIKRRAEAATGEPYDKVLSGRPVRFHSADSTRNAQAEIDLRDCYLAAGFDDVRFMPEPEAAALANRGVLAPGDLGLVVDIGGGTSDFTLFRNGDAGIDILASNGVRIGGTDFDRTLSINHVMTHLGRGSQIKHAFGSDTHTAPATIFNDLATWQKIPFLYAPEARRLAKDLAQYAAEPVKLGRLVSVLADELGHDIAFAVEAGKIAANGAGAGVIDLAEVERGLAAPVTDADLDRSLRPLAEEVSQAAVDTVAAAGLPVDAVTHLIFVGGSSLMQVIERALRARFATARLHRGAALTAIIDGLALNAEAAFA